MCVLYLTSTRAQLPLITCYGKIGQIYMFGPPITDDQCQMSWQLGWLWFGRSSSFQYLWSSVDRSDFPFLSSLWILSIVAIAWVGSITTYVILFALNLPRYSYRTLSQFTSWSLEIDLVKSGFYVSMIRRTKLSMRWCGSTWATHWYSWVLFWWHDSHNIIGCGKPISRLFHPFA